MPVAAVSSLHGDPEDPIPAIGNSTLLDEVDDEMIVALLEASGGESGSTLIAAELRQLGGVLRQTDEAGGVADRINGEFIAFGVGVAADPGIKAKTEADLDRLFDALNPWQSGQQFYNFAIAGSTCANCYPEEAIEALKAIRHEYDPESLFLAPLDL
jgi:hypothetical protein